MKPTSIDGLDKIGEIVKAARKRRGWTQRKLAVVAGLSNGVVAKLELGRPVHSTTIEKVLGALSLQLRWTVAPEPKPAAEPDPKAA